MKNNHKKFCKSALSVCIAALLTPGAYSAEQQPKEKEAKAEVERIIVTGSNIYKGGSANFSSSAPITEVDDELIEGVASISVEDVLNRIPSITSELSASSSNLPFGGFANDIGVSTTSLRNLGSARTLVLVNGRRYVSGVSANSGYGVDLNSIPTATIDRIDVLTGGQSAIYGSDAIAGVINIITKKEFEGIEFNGFGADSSEGGAARQNIDFTYGKNYDAGNTWISIGVANQDGLDSSDRDFAANELRYVDADGDGIREAVAVRNGPAHVPGAALFAGGINIFGDGSPFNTNQPLLDSNFNRLSSTDFDNQHAGRKIVSPYKRFHIASGTTIDVSDNSYAELEFNYAQTTSSSALEPAPLSVVGNVFRVGAGGTTGIDVATSPYFVGSSAGEQLVAALGDDTSLDRVQTFRRLSEFGPQVVSQRRSTFRVAASYNYEFENDMRLQNSVVYGVTSQSQNKTGDVALTQMAETLNIEADGNGGYQCANPVARALGCVPTNPFNTTDSLVGQAGITGFSQQAVDYIGIDTGQNGELRQFVVKSVLSGDLPFELEEGPLSFAAGIEYRKEEARETPDSFRQLGISRDLPISDIKGDFDVAEIFGELYAPVAEWLNVSLAARFSDYSTVGSTSTYRLGLDAPINEVFRIRASQSKSVRAPNINDLFSTGSTGVAPTNTDPCNGVDANTSGNIATNCRSISTIADRIDQTGAFTLVASEANNTSLTQTGSLDLKEETADAMTLGLVITPDSNWSASIDYYNIEIEDGITRVGPDVFVRRCYDVDPSNFDATCGGNLYRDSNDGPILNLRSTLINANTIKTSGIDVELSYFLDNLNLSLNANFLGDYDVIDVSGSTEEFAGRPRYPDMRVTLTASYNVTDELNLFTQLRYRDETKAFLGDTDLSDDLNTLDSVFYVDLKASYQVNDSLSAYIGTNNLLDQEPDLNPRGSVRTVGTNTEPTAYDVIGRQIFAGFKFKF